MSRSWCAKLVDVAASAIILGLSLLSPNPSVGGTPNPIVIKGNLMYDAVTKERFYIKGVTYAPNPVCVQYYDDAIADDYSNEFLDWEADMRDMMKLNINTIRLYQVSPFKTHKKFMELAQSLGLYVIVAVSGTQWGYLPAALPSPRCYSDVIEGYGNVGTNLLFNAKALIKEFSKYPNTLMFDVANELMLNAGSLAFPCLKALVRDVHQWQASCAQGMRVVPLVYATQDMGHPVRKSIGDYLTCSFEGEDDIIDVVGLNTYCYCIDGVPYTSSNPYFGINEDYKNYEKPFIFTEFGCTNARHFDQVEQMMTNMQETMSGGLVYEYSDHGGYGVVTNKGTMCSHVALTWKDQAYNLQSAYSSTAYLDYPNAIGTWTEADRCEWKPPSTVPHYRSVCTTTFSTWSDPLPPTPPEDPSQPVTCPEYTLSATELKENRCSAPLMPWGPPLPSARPSHDPTSVPTHAPTHAPTKSPFSDPSAQPSHGPRPSPAPTQSLSPSPFPTAENGRSRSGVDSAGGLSTVAVVITLITAVLLGLLVREILQSCKHVATSAEEQGKPDNYELPEIASPLHDPGSSRGSPDVEVGAGVAGGVWNMAEEAVSLDNGAALARGGDVSAAQPVACASSGVPGEVSKVKKPASEEVQRGATRPPEQPRASSAATFANPLHDFPEDFATARPSEIDPAWIVGRFSTDCRDASEAWIGGRFSTDYRDGSEVSVTGVEPSAARRFSTTMRASEAMIPEEVSPAPSPAAPAPASSPPPAWTALPEPGGPSDGGGGGVTGECAGDDLRGTLEAVVVEWLDGDNGEDRGGVGGGAEGATGGELFVDTSRAGVAAAVAAAAGEFLGLGGFGSSPAEPVPAPAPAPAAADVAAAAAAPAIAAANQLWNEAAAAVAAERIRANQKVIEAARAAAKAKAEQREQQAAAAAAAAAVAASPSGGGGGKSVTAPLGGGDSDGLRRWSPSPWSPSLGDQPPQRSSARFDDGFDDHDAPLVSARPSDRPSDPRGSLSGSGVSGSRNGGKGGKGGGEGVAADAAARLAEMEAHFAAEDARRGGGRSGSNARFGRSARKALSKATGVRGLLSGKNV